MGDKDLTEAQLKIRKEGTRKIIYPMIRKPGKDKTWSWWIKIPDRTFPLDQVVDDYKYEYQEDSAIKDCNGCSRKFTPTLRKHHCWGGCGKIFCSTCAPKQERKCDRICFMCDNRPIPWLDKKRPKCRGCQK